MDDIKKQLEVIAGLMDQLQEEMEYGEEDFASRLGREKPAPEGVKVEIEKPEMMAAEEMPEMEEEEAPAEMIEAEGPEDSLKKRLMKMRA